MDMLGSSRYSHRQHMLRKRPWAISWICQLRLLSKELSDGKCGMDLTESRLLLYATHQALSAGLEFAKQNTGEELGVHISQPTRNGQYGEVERQKALRGGLRHPEPRHIAGVC
jgi:hypothetical protein